MSENPPIQETSIAMSSLLSVLQVNPEKWLTRLELFELMRLLTRFRDQQSVWAERAQSLTLQMIQAVFQQYVTQVESLLDGLTKEG